MIPSVTIKDMKRMVGTFYNARIPIFVWGNIGIGKSAGLKQGAQELGKEMGLEFSDTQTNGEKTFGWVDFRMSQIEPPDIRGVMMGDKDNKTTIYYVPSWLPKNPKSKGIIFLDELNQAPHSILSACFQLVLDRKIGDYKLPDGWVVWGAGNTGEDRANVYELPKPLSNRFAHLKLEKPTSEDWIKWAIDNGVSTDICMFIEQHPSHLHNFNKNDKSEAFATPRTWVYADTLLKANKHAEDTERLVASAVGDGVAHEFSTFIKLKNKIDIADLFKNPKKVKEIKEIDLKYSLISVLTEKYRDNAKNLEPILNVCEHFENEFAILLLKYISAIGKDKFFRDAIKLKQWLELSKVYGKFLS